MPYNHIYDYYRLSDIVIGTLHGAIPQNQGTQKRKYGGWYGMVAIEGMASGKPVCGYINESLEAYLPDYCPLIRVNLRNFHETMRVLIEDETLRTQLGSKGREYVRRMHDSLRIAKRVNKIYESL